MIVGHPELAQPGAERDAALPSTDDDDIGLGLVPELRRLALAALEPRLPLGVGPVLDPLRPAGPDRPAHGP